MSVILWHLHSLFWALMSYALREGANQLHDLATLRSNRLLL
jgi:hypothetical protein